MSIDSIKFGLQQIAPIQKPQVTVGTPESAPTGKASFGEMFGNAIKEVDKLQTEADKQIEGITTGKDGITPHGAMIALEKADIAFQLMTTIRTKIITAYQEVLRTQV
ncbi:MAG: flagellar hook-basal body complex protein FliE [Deltaproteobacteria bacterium]|nr:flagellar hook-basal body complex protein FliE [Deltaproteobacteria bacterium]